jgi:Flp pilus assembly protein TadG
MLVPAGIMVLLVLGSIAMDSALAYMGQRELQNMAAATANDAATQLIPANSVSRDGVAAPLDERDLGTFVAQRFAVSPVDGLTITDSSGRYVDGEVIVEAHGRVRYLFARALPGVAREQAVVARASATPDRD